MAINLSQLSRPTSGKPIVATLFGEAGTGKTTLAAMFPRPVFIRTEDGTASLDGHPDAMLFPVARSTQDVFDAIEALATQDHDRKTLVIDSVTQFEKIATREILDSETNPKCKSLAAAHGGFGKAYGLLEKKHFELREACEYLVTDVGMNVVFIAHATTEKMDLPDMDAYSRYTVQLFKNDKTDCQHHYTNNADLVAFIRLVTNLRGTDGGKKRALSDGAREIIAFPVASNVSKNRMGLTEPLPFDLAGAFPFEQYVAK